MSIINNKKVLVLYGGLSHEREISLVTGMNVANALKKKYEVILHDFVSVKNLVTAIEQEKPDVVFNALHGKFGEDGKIQGLLDLLQIPYTHSGVKASAIGMDKDLCKHIAKSNNIPVASSQKMRVKDFLTNGTNMDMPYAIKPNREGSSVGVFIIQNQQDLKNLVFEKDDEEILIEKFIPGREFTVGVLYGKAMDVTEICPQTGFYDYSNKYEKGRTTHILPALINPEIKEKMLKYTEMLYEAIGCNGAARADFRYNDQDGIILLEINTQPGMTELSLLPEQAAYIGYSYEQLCELILKGAQFEK